MDLHHDVLIVIAELLAEDIDAARSLGALIDPDPQPDGVMVEQSQLGQRDVGRLRSVDAGPSLGNDPGRQVAVLRTLKLPPAG